MNHNYVVLKPQFRDLWHSFHQQKSIQLAGRLSTDSRDTCRREKPLPSPGCPVDIVAHPLEIVAVSSVTAENLTSC